MDIILVPGFWLDASSWDEVTPALEAAGHHPHPLTLPGLESPTANREGIELHHHVDAVVEAIDALSGPVVLVGHSGGGAVIHGAVDARPDRVARAIYVDSGPLGEGRRDQRRTAIPRSRTFPFRPGTPSRTLIWWIWMTGSAPASGSAPSPSPRGGNGPATPAR